MHITKKIATSILGLLGSAAAFATPPAAPQVTVGADIKELQFDWDIVPHSNYYEFWYKSDNGAPWVKFGEQKPWEPHFVNHVGAHLFNWDQARYQVKACNSVCTASAAIGVHDQMFDSIGYFKPSGTYRDAAFGLYAAISEDGQTLAAFAHEPVPGGTISALYVFAKVNGAWQQQKRIIPSTTMPNRQNLGGLASVSLSADGNRLVTQLSVCSTQRFDCYPMVSVWTRSGSTWTREYQLVGPDKNVQPDPVQIDEAGDRVLGGPSTNQPEIFDRTASGWVKHAPLPAISTDYRCDRVRLSGDGNTLARACGATSGGVRLLIAKAPDWNVTQTFNVPWPEGHLFGGFAIDYAGSTLALATSADIPDGFPNAPDRRAQVLVLRIANGTLSTSVLRAESWASQSKRFGEDVALSRNGGYLAVYAFDDDGSGRGVLSPPLQPGGATIGATNIYELRSTGPHLRRVIKPENADPYRHTYGDSVAFANDGKTLLLGDPNDSSAATGVDGNRNDTSKGWSGALWLY